MIEKSDLLAAINNLCRSGCGMPEQREINDVTTSRQRSHTRRLHLDNVVGLPPHSTTVKHWNDGANSDKPKPSSCRWFDLEVVLWSALLQKRGAQNGPPSSTREVPNCRQADRQQHLWCSIQRPAFHTEGGTTVSGSTQAQPLKQREHSVQ